MTVLINSTRRGWIGGLTALVLAICAAAQAEASPYSEAERRDVRIEAGDIVLAATLYRPRGARGDLPAVVTGHGSAPNTRENMSFFTNMALSMGFAVLTFDKRGVGESTGVFPEWSVERSPQDFQNLANDIVYSVRWLAEQRGIDERRIGLIGGSQAGWVMPLAASQETRVRFVVTVGGVSIEAGREDAHETYLEDIPRAANGAPAWRHFYAADMFATDFAGEMGYDPGPVLESLDIPMLWIWGLYDDGLPTIPSIHRIGELMAAGKTNHTVHILPYANHNLYNVFTQQRYNIPSIAEPWLREQGFLTRSRTR